LPGGGICARRGRKPAARNWRRGIGEVVLAEAANLLDDLFGEGLVVAALEHAVDQSVVHVLEATAAIERRGLRDNHRSHHSWSYSDKILL